MGRASHWLLMSLAVFACFFANVLAGAVGIGGFLPRVAEAILILVFSATFVTGIVKSEAQNAALKGENAEEKS